VTRDLYHRSIVSESIYPAPEEVPALVPGPGTIVYDRASDARAFLSSGYALILQVSHPTVGAGVTEHSDYKSDPWGRLFRTLDFVNVTLYGGPEAAAEMCRRVREMHKKIKGVKPDGTRYHALEPEAYAWVHATLGEAIISANRNFGRPLEDGELEEFWGQWRGLGRLLGVRERDLPEDLEGFRSYLSEMFGKLEPTQAARDVFDDLESPTPPPVAAPLRLAARAAGVPASHVLSLATIGQLTPGVRERLGLPWSKGKQLQFRAISRAARAATPLMPQALRQMGPNYLRWRHEAIARGDVTAGAESRAKAQPQAA